MSKKSKGRILRDLLAGDKMVVAPGSWDGLSIKLVERAGFPATYITGNGLAAVHGTPDVNYLTMSEVVDAMRFITRASNIPAIADADSGFGGPLNIARCVREFEEAGLAALHIEDQPFPKRAVPLGGLTFVSEDEMCERIRIAVEARNDPDFVIIARTDTGGDEGIRRLNAYRDAGADVLFMCGITTIEYAKRTIAEVPGIHLYNYRGGDNGPMLDHREIEALGFKMLMYSIHGLRLMVKSYEDMLASLSAEGDVRPWLKRMITWDQYLELTGIPEFLEFERRHTRN